MPIRLILLTLAVATTLLAQNSSPPPVSPIGPRLGARVLALHDIDGDAIADYVAAAPTDGSLGPNFTGRVELRSGANDALVWQVFGSLVGEQAGYGLGLADWNGDGLDEVVIAHQPAAGLPPALHVHDAATGTTLAILPIPAAAPWIEIGQSIDAADLDGDVKEEILVTAAGSDSRSVIVNRPPGAVVLFYAAGGPAAVITDPNEGDFGRTAAFCGDLDGDGFPDILIGSPTADITVGGNPVANVGLVRALRGSTLTTWWDLRGTAAQHSLGRLLLPLPDQDGDLVADLALVRFIAATIGNHELIEIRSGLNGAALGIANLPASTSTRGPLRLLPDGDGDGGLELAVGSLAISAAALPLEIVDVVSLGDLHHVDRIAAPFVNTGFAADFDLMPDTDGDGLSELLIGEPDAFGTMGRVTRMNLAPALSALAEGSPNHDLLQLNGSAHLPSRRANLAIGQPFTIGIEPDLATGQPTDFVLWGLVGVPDAASAVTVAGGATFLFPPRIAAPGLPWLFCLADSLGFDPAAAFPAVPAPWTLGAPFGLPMAIDVTLQGVTVSGGLVEITNGVLLHVR